MIGLGTAYTIADSRDDAAAIQIIRHAIELGVTVFDTANVYGNGVAEERLGRALHTHPREKIRIMSKAFHPMDGAGGLSRSEVHRQCEASLRRLRTDYLDVYLCHDWDPEVPLDETLDALAELVEAGRIRRAGFCRWPLDEISRAHERMGPAIVGVSSSQYSLLHREPELGLFDLCEHRAIEQVVWGVLAEGVLTGKYRPARPPPTPARVHSKQAGQTIGRFLAPDVLERVAELASVADAHGLTCAQLSIAWALANPAVDVCLIGASAPSQLDELVGAADVTLSPELRSAVGELVTLDS